ncbi:DNA polymerase alpha-binding protein [Diutina catenulata]
MEVITAFPEGNSLVTFSAERNRLLVGNSAGILKVFDVADPELEPVSVDIVGNLCSVTTAGSKAVITNTEGNVEVVDLDKNESTGVIYRSELPVRAAVVISGDRVACGGGDGELVICGGSTGTVKLRMEDQVVSMAYSEANDLLAVGLANGAITILSMVNETPNVVHTLADVMYHKLHMSSDSIDYHDEHADELVCTQPRWSADGELLMAPTATNSVAVYSRSSWNPTETIACGKCHDIHVSGRSLAVVGPEGVQVYAVPSGQRMATQGIDGDKLLLNTWVHHDTVYAGTSAGEVVKIGGFVQNASDGVSALFVDEADEADTDDELAAPAPNDQVMEDDRMLGESDDEDLGEPAPKRHKANGHAANGTFAAPTITLLPYSPGSTPWALPGAAIDRRYMAMNSIGYTWVNKTGTGLDARQSITVSFFDQSVHNEYHFTEVYGYDLCSLNQHGVALAVSGHATPSNANNGVLFYRKHDGDGDAWERKIPLLKGEYITSLALSSPQDESEQILVVGTSLGYLRVYSAYGVALNVMKTTPVVAVMASGQGTMVSINLFASGYTYSVVDAHDDYRFIQQDQPMPLVPSLGVPLLKGMFFNEYGDPCIVGGADDTLLTLHSWRETNNARWVPLLNCHHAVTVGDDDGSTRANWKCWPLGVMDDKLHAIVLKQKSVYPGFPLPLPIEFDLQIPVIAYGVKSENEPEEMFIRSLVMGKMVSDCAACADDDELTERLDEYTSLFDKSLLMLFGESCKESKLARAFSVAKMIKTDRALVAATKISERMNFNNLATKISELRNQLDE